MFRYRVNDNETKKRIFWILAPKVEWYIFLNRIIQKLWFRFYYLLTNNTFDYYFKYGIRSILPTWHPLSHWQANFFFFIFLLENVFNDDVDCVRNDVKIEDWGCILYLISLSVYDVCAMCITCYFKSIHMNNGK